MWFGKQNPEARLDGELRYHFEKLVRDFVAEGIAPAEARRLARLEFGGMEQIKEECRDMRRTQWLEAALQDCRFGIRTFRKRPSFTLSVLAILAFGIGSATAIFSIVNGVLFRQPPVRSPERVVVVAFENPATGSNQSQASALEFMTLKKSTCG